MFRKIIYVFLGFFATVFALNVETGFNDGIMNVTLYEVEGLAQGECGDNGFTECPDRGSPLPDMKGTVYSMISSTACIRSSPFI